jgi:photosystem II stability/assembly factor-like uncharacterized protein
MAAGRLHRHALTVSILVLLCAGVGAGGGTTRSHGQPTPSATHHGVRPDSELERPDPGGLPDGGGVESLVFTAGEPHVLYAAFSFGGVFRSSDAGRTWAAADRGLPPTLPCELAADPQHRDTVYAACLGRLFKTADGGQRWQQLDVDDAEPPLIAPSDSRVIYQPSGGMVSRDGGRRWIVRPHADRWSSGPCVAIDPTDPSHLVAASDAGVEHSVDGGLHWSALNGGLDPEHRAQELAISPLDRHVMIARTATATYRTGDGGASWQPIGSPLPPANVARFRFDGTSAHVLTVLNQEELLRSPDAGDHWRSLSASLQQPVTAWATHPATPSLIAVATARGVFVTRDEGATWLPAFADIRRTNVTVSAGEGAASPLQARVANDVLTSDDDGRTWSVAPPTTLFEHPGDISRPAFALAIERFTRISGQAATSIAPAPSRPERLFVGTGGLVRPQLWRSDDRGVGWTLVRTCSERWPGTGCAAQVDPRDPDVVYALTRGEYIDGGAALARSADGGIRWDDEHQLGSIDLFAVVPTAPTTALAWATGPDGRRRLYRSDDRGAQWTGVGAGLPAGIELTSLVSSPRDPAHLFAGTAGRGLFHSRDRGATWTPVR